MMLGLDLSGARRMCWFISLNFVLSNGRGEHVEGVGNVMMMVGGLHGAGAHGANSKGR